MREGFIWNTMDYFKVMALNASRFLTDSVGIDLRGFDAAVCKHL